MVWRPRRAGATLEQQTPFSRDARRHRSEMMPTENILKQKTRLKLEFCSEVAINLPLFTNQFSTAQLRSWYAIGNKALLCSVMSGCIPVSYER